jgi:hypothetical protein
MADPRKVAEKVAQRAAEALDPLRIEMISNRWPADLRAIMWRAVADTAARLASESFAMADKI